NPEKVVDDIVFRIPEQVAAVGVAIRNQPKDRCRFPLPALAVETAGGIPQFPAFFRLGGVPCGQQVSVGKLCQCRLMVVISEGAFVTQLDICPWFGKIRCGSKLEIALGSLGPRLSFSFAHCLQTAIPDSEDLPPLLMIPAVDISI